MSKSYEVMSLDQTGSKMASNRRLVLFLVFLVIVLPILTGVLVWHFLPKCDDTDSSVGMLKQDNHTVTTAVTTVTTSATTVSPYGHGPWDNLRLSKTVRPVHYRIVLFPDFYGDHGWFYGNESIELNITERTKYVLVHTNYLNITNTQMTDKTTGENIPILRTFEFKANQFWVVECSEELLAGSSVVLDLQFEGSLTAAIVGLYKSSYTDSISGEQRSIATSKFEPVAARRAFPCMDEPAMKAQFSITLVHKPGYIALSNMPVAKQEPWEDNPGLTATEFQRSVTMSTYLVCFIVCDFVYLEKNSSHGNQVRVYAPRDRINQTRYSLDVALTTIDMYTDLFNVSYPLPKLDLIAIPDFVSGAMEHWGLITFRETSVLYDPDQASASNKQRVAVVVAHEVAHMWFGNLVTMAWWNDLWLNEGFASFMEYLGADRHEPTWEMLDQFSADDLQPVLVKDAQLSSHPIIVNVSNPDQLNAVFDSISYNKGSSIIRMLENMLGKDIFFKGVSKYLKQFPYQNAVTDDLWQYLTEASGINVKEVMDTWTLQMGFPYIDVSVDVTGQKVIVEQHRFLSDANIEFDSTISPFNYTWYIPLTYITNDNTNGSHSMAGTYEESFQVPVNLSRSDMWIKFNWNQYGYYRVNYPTLLWQRFANTLLNDSTILEASDKSNLIDDAFNLARAGYLNYTVAMDMTLYLSNENEYLPWDSAMNGLGYVASMFKYDSAYGLLRKYVMKKAVPVLTTLSWDDTGFHLDRLLRGNILALTCGYGDEACLAVAETRFQDWLHRNASIPPNLRSAVYKYGMQRSSDPADWEVMWQRYLAETNVQEKVKLMSALSHTSSVWLLARYIEYAQDEQYVRSQDYFTVMTYIARNPVGRNLVWNWLRQNWEYLVGRFTLYSRYFGRFVPAVVSSFNTEFQQQEVLEFFNRYPDAGSGEMGRKQALESIATNIAWMKRNKDTIENWLEQNS